MNWNKQRRVSDGEKDQSILKNFLKIVGMVDFRYEPRAMDEMKVVNRNLLMLDCLYTVKK